jgi:glycerate-2-kinase
MPDLKSEAVRIYLETLKRIDVRRLVEEKVQLAGEVLTAGADRIDLSEYDEVVVIGLGKASLQIASALARILGDRISRGVLVTNRKSRLALPSSVSVIVSAHPTPDARSVEAARAILREVGACTERSLLFFIVSGGGSALAELPVSDQLSLDDLRRLNELLVGSGATISEINTVRKVLSQIKGGKTGYLARRTRTVALFLSDVNPGDLFSLASNPLLPEEVSIETVSEILTRHRLLDELPSAIRTELAAGRKAFRAAPFTSASFPAASFPGKWGFENGLTTLLLADNAIGRDTAAGLCRERGWVVEVCEDLVEQSYEAVAAASISRLRGLLADNPGRTVCLISGGEVSCAVRGEGLGGRNQEFVLYSAASLDASRIGPAALSLSAGTDGIDGKSLAAGAVADSGTVTRAGLRGYAPASYLADSDSSSFFSEAGGLVVSGPTGNNVRDIRIMIAGGDESASKDLVRRKDP